MLRIGVALVAVLAAAAQGGSRMTEASAATAGGFLLVANKGDHTLGIIDPAAGRQVATVEESGVTGHEVIASPDGRTAYVPIYGNSGVGRPGTDGQTLDVIDIASRRRVATIDFGRPERPHCAQFGPDGRLYVTTEVTNTISVIDPKTQKIAYGTAPTPDGRFLVVALLSVNKVGVIDLRSMQLAHTIDVPKAPQEVLVRPDGAVAYVSCDQSRQIAVIDLKEW